MLSWQETVLSFLGRCTSPAQNAPENKDYGMDWRGGAQTPFFMGESMNVARAFKSLITLSTSASLIKGSFFRWRLLPSAYTWAPLILWSVINGSDLSSNCGPMIEESLQPVAGWIVAFVCLWEKYQCSPTFFVFILRQSTAMLQMLSFVRNRSQSPQWLLPSIHWWGPVGTPPYHYLYSPT